MSSQVQVSSETSAPVASSVPASTPTPVTAGGTTAPPQVASSGGSAAPSPGSNFEKPVTGPPPTRLSTGAAVAGSQGSDPSGVVPQFQRQTSIEAPASGTPGKGKKSKSKRKPSPSVTMATAVTAQVGNNNSSENTGRWTAEEHRLFLQGLDQHGKGWKKIASLIKSRTVVQIRTHAQKYFQKLAKARQNGEVTEGDHHFNMEGRSSGGMTLAANHTVPNSVINPSQHAPATKKRKQLNGTKRKSISSVVHSVTSETKAARQKREPKTSSVSASASAAKTAPSVAPALAPYVVQPPAGASPALELSPSQLEDSLFRFLTPATVENTAPPGAKSSAAAPQMPAGFTSMLDPIKVPDGDHAGQLAGEISPTGVADISFPSIPSWYSRGADVDDLLNEADALDWLADSGDLDETYSHILPKAASSALPPDAPSVCTASDAGSDAGAAKPAFAPAPADEGAADVHPAKRVKYEPNDVTPGVECGVGEDQFAVFDSAFDEQAFVSALLDGEGGNPALPALTN